MNRRRRRTLDSVFADPASAMIAWSDVESLLESIGCGEIEAKGSGVKFEKDGVVASFHRPHPEKEAKRYRVRDARAYLVRPGVEP